MSSCASSGFLVTEAPPSEELDVKAGGGCVMNIGEMLRHFLTKLEWYSTLFPRIPVPIQKEIEKKLSARGPLTKSLKAGQSKDGPAAASTGSTTLQESRHIPDEEVSWGEAERISRLRRSASRERKLRRDEKKENGKFEEEEDKDRYKGREKESSKREDRKEPQARPSREEKREREWRDDRRSRERERDRRSNWDIADEIAREKERQKKERTDRDYRSRSRSRDRRHRSRSRDRRRSRSRSRDHHHKDRRHRSRSRDHHVNHKSESRSRDRR